MNKSGILAIILLTLYVLYYYFYVVEQFTNNTVVTVYNSKCYFGLGDYIRGVIHLYQNMNDKSIFVNYEDNEIAHYLYNANNNNHSYIQDKIVSTDQTNYAINIVNKTKPDVINTSFICISLLLGRSLRIISS